MTATTSVLVSEVGGVVVAVAALLVDSIDPVLDADPIDTADLLGVPAPPGRRRCVRLGSCDLLLGRTVTLETYPPESILPFPASVRHLGARLGSGRLFLREGRFVYLLDPELVRGAVARSNDPSGEPRC